MTDATVDRLTRLLADGHLRWHDGRIQVHPTCAELDRAWLQRHRDAITVALTPFADEATAVDHLVDLFPNSQISKEHTMNTITATTEPGKMTT